MILYSTTVNEATHASVRYFTADFYQWAENIDVTRGGHIGSIIHEAKDKAEQVKMKLAETKGRAKQKADDLRAERKQDGLERQGDGNITVPGP